MTCDPGHKVTSRVRFFVVLLASVACSGSHDSACKNGDVVPAGDGCHSCTCSSGRWTVPELGCSQLRPPLDGSPACYLLGLADVEQDVPGLQIDCHANTDRPDGTSESVPRCTNTTNGFDWPSPAATLCWYVLLNADASAACVAESDQHQVPPAEFGVLHRPGPDEGVYVDIECMHPPQCPGAPEDSD